MEGKLIPLNKELTIHKNVKCPHNTEYGWTIGHKIDRTQ